MNVNTIDRLIELKAEGHKIVYYFEYEGLDILFRPLTFEQNDIIYDLERYLDGATINDTIIKMTVLHVSDPLGIEYWLNHTRALVPDLIAQKIIDVSGFNNPEKMMQIVEESREKANQLESLLESFICSAFHTISPDQCKAMTLQEQLELFTKAEVILGKTVDFNKVFKPETARTKALKSYPKPDGMMSTDDLLGDEGANKFDWNKVG